MWKREKEDEHGSITRNTERGEILTVWFLETEVFGLLKKMTGNCGSEDKKKFLRFA